MDSYTLGFMLRLIQILFLAFGTFIILVFVPLFSPGLGFPGEILSGILLLLIALFIYSRRDTLTLVFDKSNGLFEYTTRNSWRTLLLSKGRIENIEKIKVEESSESFHSRHGRVTTKWYTLVLFLNGASRLESISYNDKEKATESAKLAEDYLASDEQDPLILSGKEPYIAIIAYGLLAILFLYLGISKVGCETRGGIILC